MFLGVRLILRVSFLCLVSCVFCAWACAVAKLVFACVPTSRVCLTVFCARSYTTETDTNAIAHTNAQTQKTHVHTQ